MLRLALTLIAIQFVASDYAQANPADVQTRYPIVTSSLQPTSATVGQQLKLSLNVVAPELTRVAVKAPFAEGKNTSWTLVGKPIIKDEQLDGKEWRRRIEYTLACFEVGDIPAPHVEVSYQPPGEAEPVTRTLPEIIVHIRSVLPADAEHAQLRDIKPPVPLPYPRWLFYSIAAIATLIVAAIAWLVFRRLRGKVGALFRPDVPLDVWALQEIARTESDRLIEQKKTKELYTRLTDTIRRYLGTLHGFPAWDMTSGELFFQLEDRQEYQPGLYAPAYRDALTRMHDLFDEADLVKFAKFLPEPAKCRQAVEKAREIVRLTRYKLDPPTPGEEGPSGTPTERPVSQPAPPPVPLAEGHQSAFRPAPPPLRVESTVER